MLKLKFQYFGHLMWRTDSLIKTLVFPGGSDVELSACNVGDLVSIPRSGRSPRKRNGYPFQFLSGEFHGPRILVGYIKSMGSQRVGHSRATNILCINRSSVRWWLWVHENILCPEDFFNSVILSFISDLCLGHLTLLVAKWQFSDFLIPVY